ncbi:hypothetical protein JAO73_04925 [Hymenobacter sp. BT523]|uniref:hypothetical protein n=1 Tax=Hymenobacter sp. BT523 TaxID=2795725 RepID=UPI0018EBCDC5|nr:hypothetical protein [Hymenobacter sp. BT523]MBJ6108342.1 hypothetical protein [Hymenobacter sp. BT523]
MESNIQVGDFLEFDGLLCIVVALAGRYGDEDIPEEHIAVWFGGNDPAGKPVEEERFKPAIWTIPQEYFKKTPRPEVLH